MPSAHRHRHDPGDGPLRAQRMYGNCMVDVTVPPAPHEPRQTGWPTTYLSQHLPLWNSHLCAERSHCAGLQHNKPSRVTNSWIISSCFLRSTTMNLDYSISLECSLQNIHSKMQLSTYSFGFRESSTSSTAAVFATAIIDHLRREMSSLTPFLIVQYTRLYVLIYMGVFESP